jgi:cytosine deaminase
VTAAPTSVLRNARLADGRLVDLTIAGERIAGIGSAAPRLGPPTPGVVEHDLAGKLVLPAPAEPHAHLDKAFTADRVPNPAGDLAGAIAAMGTVRGRWKRADVEDRAERAARTLLAAGCTAIRSHADVTPATGTRHAEALVAVRERLRGLVEIQVVALMGVPVCGRDGADQRARLADALDLGVDVVGGAPYLEDEPRAAYEHLVGLAGERGLAIDLHTDETLDPSVLTVRDFAAAVTAAGYAGPAVASHCVSLGMADAGEQRRVAEELAAASIGVVALPQTNLFLQARGVATAPPRGLTALGALRAAGVTVAGGADNLQDPFNLVGRGDPLETAALLVMAGHLAPDDAYDLVSNAARRALGLPPVTLAPGSPAELLAVDAANVREAIASAPAARTVVHRGRVVATTTVTVEISPQSGTGHTTAINRSLAVRAATIPYS